MIPINFEDIEHIKLQYEMKPPYRTGIDSATWTWTVVHLTDDEKKLFADQFQQELKQMDIDF